MSLQLYEADGGKVSLEDLRMKITEVKVYLSKDSGRLKAYVTLVFDDCFIVRDVKVIEGNKGYFVSMPSRRRKDGSFRDIVHPLNSETRKMIEEVVVNEFKKVSEFGGAAGSAEDMDADMI